MLIIGGGAAGLSAALVLLRARRRVVVVDAGAPRNAPAAHMHGFLSQDGTCPADLVAAGRVEIARYGGCVITGTVDSLTTGFIARLSDGRSLQVRRVLMATGLRDVLPDLPGVQKRWGRDLLHCPYCHGWEVQDQPIGVIGGDAAAVQHALLIRQWSPDVLRFSGTGEPPPEEQELLAARGVGLVTGGIRALRVEQDRLTGIDLEVGRHVPRAAVFVRPRFVPNHDLLLGLGCHSEDTGWIRRDPVGRTTVDGVWVAGNVGNPGAQVITAAGEGSTAAIAVNADLVNEDLSIALARDRTHRDHPLDTTRASP